MEDGKDGAHSSRLLVRPPRLHVLNASPQHPDSRVLSRIVTLLCPQHSYGPSPFSSHPAAQAFPPRSFLSCVVLPPWTLYLDTPPTQHSRLVLPRLLTLEFRMSSMARLSYGANPATSRTTLLTTADRWDSLPFLRLARAAGTRRVVLWPLSIPQTSPDRGAVSTLW